MLRQFQNSIHMHITGIVKVDIKMLKQERQEQTKSIQETPLTIQDFLFVRMPAQEIAYIPTCFRRALAKRHPRHIADSTNDKGAAVFAPNCCIQGVPGGMCHTSGGCSLC
jgi:hypothetical protein